MYIETIYKTWCENCNISNFINNGNETDFTIDDTFSFKCHRCGHIHLFRWNEMDDFDREDVFGSSSYEEALKIAKESIVRIGLEAKDL